MSVEHIPSISTELVVVEREPILHIVGPRDLGKHALLFEGFEPMEDVESPYSETRAELETKIIGQPDAISAIFDALERSEIRLPDDKRPIANLAFLGPTGVGKSEVAKTMSKLLGENGGNLIKIDCSDFSHGHEIASLTGSPAGYKDSDRVPVLNKKSVEQPGTIVLFDETEKGSTELWNTMLQIMGDGELHLNNGETTSFQNTIVILTSNLGAKEMAKRLSDTPIGFGGQNKQAVSKSDLETTAVKSFKKFFSPEFVNRLNKMVVFHPLEADSLAKVLDVKLDQANNQYERQLGARISLSEATKDHLVEMALKEPDNGARPLVRALEDKVQTVFGRYVGGGHIKEGTHIRVFHTSEAPDNYSKSGESDLIFTAKLDQTLKKEVIVINESLFSEPSSIEALPANPEEYYGATDLDDVPDDDGRH